MIFEGVSSFEVLRFLVAVFGLTVSWGGRARAREGRDAILPAALEDASVRRKQEQWAERMYLFERIQTGCIAIHAMFLANVIVNMGYVNPPIEQPNVLSSNVIQILIPLILARLSELITLKLEYARSLHVVTGKYISERPADP